MFTLTLVNHFTRIHVLDNSYSHLYAPNNRLAYINLYTLQDLVNYTGSLDILFREGSKITARFLIPQAAIPYSRVSEKREREPRIFN